MTTTPRNVFGSLADEYARFRPSYPPELFDAIWTRLKTPTPRAVDLAAGAGAATAPLVARGARVIAVEPAGAMLTEAHRRVAGPWVGVAARAEALPLIGGSADLVTVAQAFHWFDPGSALEEAARVLVSGGVLALFWNVTEHDDFVHDVARLVERWNPNHERPVNRRMLATPPALAGHSAFEVEPPREIFHSRPMDAESYVGYAFSWSYVGGALAPEDRTSFERELRALIERHHGGETWEERFLTALHLARRR